MYSRNMPNAPWYTTSATTASSRSLLSPYASHTAPTSAIGGSHLPTANTHAARRGGSRTSPVAHRQSHVSAAAAKKNRRKRAGRF